MNHIQVPVSVGELLDKITILEIKLQNIKDEKKLENIRNEEQALKDVCVKNGISCSDSLFSNLKNVNLELWDIEDKIRLKEKAKEFDEEFVSLARAVYVTNDKRFDCKSLVNEKYGSNLREEKSYEDYQ